MYLYIIILTYSHCNKSFMYCLMCCLFVQLQNVVSDQKEKIQELEAKVGENSASAWSTHPACDPYTEWYY